MDSGDTTFYTASSGLSDADPTPTKATFLSDHSSSLYEDQQMQDSDEVQDEHEVITNVWAGNFEVEFAKIQNLVQSNKLTYVAFDTEFAGFLRFGPESMYE